MKMFGKELKEVNKGYFGVRRCTICNDELRDVELVEIYAESHMFFVPISRKLIKRILVCKHCNAYMEIDDKLWKYYDSYYNKRFDKATTDSILEILTTMTKQMEQNGVKLSIGDKTSEASLDLIYNRLAQKYEVEQNIEEIVSVFYK